MKQIKYFALAIILMSLMPGCSGNANKDDESARRIDSTDIQDAQATLEAENDSLLALMDEINEGMIEIKKLQDIVTVQDLGSETPDRKRQLRSDIIAIQRAITEREQKLAELERRLSQSNNYNERMKRTIEALKAQLSTQQTIIDDLTQQLAAAHIEIKNLNTRVDSLDNAITTVKEEKKVVQEENQRLTEDVNTLNTCYYAIGSDKELKAHKIIEKNGILRKTKIMEGDYEKNYFTRADKRTLTEIDLRSKKAKVMDNKNHPADSYNIVDAGSTKKLVITNPARFWEKSNYLVVKID
ncbi:MAG: hypothetical protein IKR25_04240 [Muribaculaceae bacterium]|nr:hypothetical protein [Muribaculaceae bacterium]